jgi:predicted MFS family arabinose efflux permease
VFLCNAASYLAVVAALTAMDRNALHPVRRDDVAVGVRDGLRYTWSVRPMRSTVLLVAVVGTLVYNFPTFITVLAEDTFHGDAGAAGLLMAVLGAGTLVGALVAAHRARQTARTVLLAGAALGTVLLAAAFAPFRPLLVALLVPTGACAVFFGATASAHMQASSAPRFRGRVMAVYSTLTLGATIVGGPLMGGVSERWGARTGLGVAGAATAAAAAALSTAARRRREEPAAAGAPSGAVDGGAALG